MRSLVVSVFAAAFATDGFGAREGSTVHLSDSLSQPALSPRQVCQWTPQLRMASNAELERDRQTGVWNECNEAIDRGFITGSERCVVVAEGGGAGAGSGDCLALLASRLPQLHPGAPAVTDQRSQHPGGGGDAGSDTNLPKPRFPPSLRARWLFLGDSTMHYAFMAFDRLARERMEQMAAGKLAMGAPPCLCLHCNSTAAASFRSGACAAENAECGAAAGSRHTGCYTNSTSAACTAAGGACDCGASRCTQGGSERASLAADGCGPPARGAAGGGGCRTVTADRCNLTKALGLVPRARWEAPVAGAGEGPVGYGRAHHGCTDR